MANKKLKMLQMLEEAWKGCVACELHRERHRVVNWRGNPDAPLALIGEAPGEHEDQQGIPFVGRAGRLLDGILKRCGIDAAEQTFIVNMVGCRPPGNRKPEREEVSACSARLQQLLRIGRPRALLLMGATAARLAGATSVKHHRGSETYVELACYDDVHVWPAVITWHPSFLLRSPSPDIEKELQDDIKLAYMIAQVASVAERQ